MKCMAFLDPLTPHPCACGQDGVPSCVASLPLGAPWHKGAHPPSGHHGPTPWPGTQVLQDPLRAFCKLPCPAPLSALSSWLILCRAGCVCTRTSCAGQWPGALQAWGPSRPVDSPLVCFGGLALFLHPKLLEGGFPRGSRHFWAPQTSGGKWDPGTLLPWPLSMEHRPWLLAWSSLLTSQAPHAQAPTSGETQEGCPRAGFGVTLFCTCGFPEVS